jgi:hypothetical protein
MENVPLYIQRSRNQLKASEFVEFNELIILIINYYGFTYSFIDQNNLKYKYRGLEKHMKKWSIVFLVITFSSLFKS